MFLHSGFGEQTKRTARPIAMHFEQSLEVYLSRRRRVQAEEASFMS